MLIVARGGANLQLFIFILVIFVISSNFYSLF